MRTDIAKEAREHFPELQGIKEEKREHDGYEIVRITVETEVAAKQLDKPIGIYSTVSFPQDTLLSEDKRNRCAEDIANELMTMLPKQGEVLVVGLGNRYITADALGTKTVENILVTRHIRELFSDVLPKRTRSVAAFCTGVLGVTGMETAEVVSALCDKIRPEAVVVVDSLAAGSAAHIGTVVQMNDTGISPGAGIGNFQPSLNRETVGVPVIAVGMPLVIGIDALLSEAVSIPEDKGYSVTPKDVDALVRNAARLLSLSINTALHRDNRTILQKLLQ